MTSLPSSVTIATPANREMSLSSPWLSTCPVSIPPSFLPSFPPFLSRCPSSAHPLCFLPLANASSFFFSSSLRPPFSLRCNFSTHNHQNTQYVIFFSLLPGLACNICTHLWESGCEMALTIASTAVSKSSGSGSALKQSCTRPSLSLRGTSSSTQDDRQRSTRAFTAPGLSVLRSSCCSKGHTDPHSRPRAPRTYRDDENSGMTSVWYVPLLFYTSANKTLVFFVLLISYS